MSFAGGLLVCASVVARLRAGDPARGGVLGWRSSLIVHALSGWPASRPSASRGNTQSSHDAGEPGPRRRPSRPHR